MECFGHDMKCFAWLKQRFIKKMKGFCAATGGLAGVKARVGTRPSLAHAMLLFTGAATSRF